MPNFQTLCHVGAILAFGVAATAQQQAGSIRGVVYDKDFDSPLADARVLIAETRAEARSNDQGIFVFDQVTPGNYTLIVSKDGYVQAVQSDVVVTANQVKETSFSLAGEFTDMEEFVVQDLLNLGAGSEAALLQLRLESASLLDSIGSDLMSRAGVSDAAGALRLVSGATVQNGKFAVVRGLPDRYVSSQLNGVRLPSADEKTRAVELDQFPSTVIESVQVSKTFTPDQQADASGGAVDIRLKGIPDERFFFEVRGQTSYNTNVRTRSDFLSYSGGGVTFSGRDGGRRNPQIDSIGSNWEGAVGTDLRDARTQFKWSAGIGGSHEFDNGIRVGGLVNVFYKQDSSFYDNGEDNSLWVVDPGAPLTPRTIQGVPQPNATPPGQFGDFKTALFDVTRGTMSTQIGTLATAGIEFEDDHKVNFAFVRTRTTEDSATLAIDTRGKEFFFPGYDPNDIDDPGNDTDNRSAAPYIRTETLVYSERKVESYILNGEHTAPIKKFGIFGAPKLTWTLSMSEAELFQPDKRQFGALWQAPANNPGAPPFLPPFVEPAQWLPFKPAAVFSLGNFQRIFKTIEEQSEQLSANFELPFEQWSDDEGYLKVGVFEDRVDRKYNEDTFSNFNDGSATLVGADFDQPWSEAFPFENHPITESTFDIDYNGEQNLSSFYAMMDLPLTSMVKVVGGVRFESTEISIANDAEGDATWFLPGAISPVELQPGQADVNFSQNDVLPAIGIEFKPAEQYKLRASYSETIARQTFRELTPIIQQEFLGGPIFIGNPELDTAELKNYDLRFDYTPSPGSLFSVSYFKKDIRDPIEVVQRIVQFNFTTPVNYPDGRLEGIELEMRQQLGEFWAPLEGLGFGANATWIDSEVSLPDDERARFAMPELALFRSKRDATNAPERLFNVNLTYDEPDWGTQIGLFYTVTGDTLLAGAGENDGNLVPDVYAKEFDNLNLTVTQAFGPLLRLRFQAKNITDARIDTEYRPPSGDSGLQTTLTRGIDYSISLGGSISF